MQVGEITQVNEKGQSVIPKKIRQALGIGKNAHINWVLSGRMVYVEPVKQIVGLQDRQSFLEILKKTQGSWGPATKEDIEWEKKVRKFRLMAAKRRRNAW